MLPHHGPEQTVTLRERLDAVAAGTVGLEEEVLLLDPVSLLPVPSADAVLERLAGDPRFKREMPAAQVELITPPRASVALAAEDLREARAVLAEAAEGLATPVAAATHPTAPAEAELNPGTRYDVTRARHRRIAHLQLVSALHVHVAVGGADRTLAVYNALRGLLPELSALAAASPFHDGRDTGLASVRPLLCGQLPRQGVPPRIRSWNAHEEDLEWGRASETVDDPGRWWWELRPHHAHGTLELRVPDVQPTVRRNAAVSVFAAALIRWLAARFDAGETLPVAPGWRIEENRWAALRDGVEGELADLGTGELRPTRDRLRTLIAAVEPHTDGPLDDTLALLERNTAMELREAGLDRATARLVSAFSG